MPSDELTERGAHAMAVCNACRYCEQYCPVFPAMERRLVFDRTDLAYLANLCHNCGECLYACQFAPPHEFGIDLPRTLAQIRHRSYEDYCWPRWLGSAFRHNGIFTAVLLAGSFAVILFVASWVTGTSPWRQPASEGDFYRVLPYRTMVTLFGAVGLFVLAALSMATVRCWRGIGGESSAPHAGATRQALSDLLSLRHLHASGADCVTAEERRSPWRRWWHHCTFYGFALCFASTSVAAIYHASGFEAPYAYTSLPVILGTVGGLGLLIGCAGLWLLRHDRDPALMDRERGALDESFLLLLFLTSLTGLLLLVLREASVMGVLLIVHLAFVLALFLSLPYGKFVHGLYRAAALAKYAREERSEQTA